LDVAEQLRNRGHEKESIEWMKCGDPAFIRAVKTCSDNPEHYSRVIGCSCHLRICPECAHRDGVRLLHQYLEPVKQSVDNKPPKWSLKHVVLTTSHHIDDADILQQYRKIYKDADQLFENFFGEDWQKSDRGLLYGAEFGEESQHLHLHCLVLCEWIDKDDLSACWESITGNKITFIRRVHGIRKAIQEMCKYVTKFTQLSAGDTVKVFEIIKGTRRIRSRGIYFGLPVPKREIVHNCRECGAPIIQMFPADFDAWKASLQIDSVEDGDLLDLIIGNKSAIPPPDRKQENRRTVDLTEKLWSDYEKLFGHQHHRGSGK
jgi:hypothetical protein